MRRWNDLSSRVIGIVAACAVVGCGDVLSLGEYSLSQTSETVDASTLPGMAGNGAGGCQRNADCAELTVSQAGDYASSAGPRICDAVTRTCVPLRSDDCPTITGDLRADDAIVLGTLFATSGPQSVMDLPREQSAILAVEEINLAGGIPVGPTAGQLRPVVLVSCDEARLERAADHLVNDLHVPAIIGPSSSQSTLDLSNQVTIPAGTLVITPSALAASLADLLDGDLTWQMVPSDARRMPLMLHAINALESQLHAARSDKALRIAVIYRDDALGQGASLALNTLSFNGLPLLDRENLAKNVRLTPFRPQHLYDFDLEALRGFLPDIVVLLGNAEVVKNILVPLERVWPAQQPRPEYVLLESSKTPELLDAVLSRPDLRARVRGTGTLPLARARSAHESFVVSYATRHPGQPADLFGMGTTYDATYAAACGIAALRGGEISGRSIAASLPALARGGQEIELQSSKTLAAFRVLAEGLPTTLIGTNAPLRWDERGGAPAGTVELWCIGQRSTGPAFASSGLTLDLGTGLTQGQDSGCVPL